MNQNTKEIAIALLKNTRRQIEIGGSMNTYICVCLGVAMHKGDVRSFRVGAALKKWISDSIDSALGENSGCPVDSWLMLFQGISQSDLTTKNLRLYRLRWIDEMIAQVEAGVAPLKIEGETE